MMDGNVTCPVGALLGTPVGELIGTSHTGHEVSEERLCVRVDVGELDPHDGVSVALTQEVRWNEFEIPPYHAATPEMVRAVERVFTDVYDASDVTVTEDGDDTFLAIEWYVRVPPTDTLGEALRLLLRQSGGREQGPVGLHNALNGGYMSRDARRDVEDAVRKASPIF